MFRLLILAACAIETLLLAFYLPASADQLVLNAITIQLLTSTVYLLSVFLILRKNQCEPAWLVPFIIVASLVFRCTMLISQPLLSDDVYRYRWEGKLQAAGGNPYQASPDDPRWAGLRDGTYPLVGSKDVKSGYGPLLELVERGTYFVVRPLIRDPHRQAWAFKLPFVLFEVLLIPVLIALIRARGGAPSRILIYAWAPLPVWEIWSSGHNDSLPVLCVAVALLAMAQRRPSWGLFWLGVGVAAKFWPLLLAPVFLRHTHGWRSRLMGAISGVAPICLLSLPYLSEVFENVRFMTGFLGGWRNNDSLFGLFLWFAGGDLQVAKRLVIATVLFVSLAVATFRWKLERAVLTVIVSVLAVAANVHPWYLTWFAPLLVFYPSRALFLWTALMPLAYVVLFQWKALGVWDGSTPWRWLIYGPVIGFILLSVVSARIRAANRSVPAAPGLPR